MLFEDLFCFSTGGWLYRSTVHIGFIQFYSLDGAIFFHGAYTILKEQHFGNVCVKLFLLRVSGSEYIILF